MENLNKIIAKNISDYRKSVNLTQLELAQKLNFSDKSVSKWERGEAIPDVAVLLQMCEIFGITLNDIVAEERPTKLFKRLHNQNHFVISLMSFGAVWCVATVIFVILLLASPALPMKWLTFIYAIPISILVALIFSCIWGKKWMWYTFATAFLWTLIVAICLSFKSSIWSLLYVAIPIQVLLILSALIKRETIINCFNAISTKGTQNDTNAQADDVAENVDK